MYTQFFIDNTHHTQVLRVGVLYAYFATGNGRGPDEAAHFHKVGANAKFTAGQALHTVDLQAIGANAFNLSAKTVQKIA